MVSALLISWDLSFEGLHAVFATHGLAQVHNKYMLQAIAAVDEEPDDAGSWQC